MIFEMQKAVKSRDNDHGFFNYMQSRVGFAKTNEKLYVHSKPDVETGIVD